MNEKKQETNSLSKCFCVTSLENQKRVVIRFDNITNQYIIYANKTLIIYFDNVFMAEASNTFLF